MIDRQLLESFVSRQDSSAFRDLVARHGPAVIRTCRRHLSDSHAAEDAFQATFLILIRRAPSIQEPELLSRWLIGVARRVAIRSRRQGVVQSERERRWAEQLPTRQEPETSLSETKRTVREELARLPSEYRRPLTLCYLEGLTYEEAAGRLGCPVGTVKTRLVRGRRLLRDRLDRRGIAPSAVLLLLLLRREASAALSDSLAESTATAMSLAGSGEVATLEALFPRAAGLSGASWRSATLAGREMSRWGLIALAFVVMGWLGLIVQGKAARAEAAAVSTKLLKVLSSDCR